MGRWRGAQLAVSTLAVVVLAHSATGAQAADRSAAFSIELAHAAWKTQPNGHERLIVQQAGLLELAAYRFVSGSYRARIMPASRAKGDTVTDVLTAIGAALVINGGYFDRASDGTLTPTGGLVSGDRELAPVTRCRACSGMLFARSGTGSLGIDWVMQYARSVYLRALRVDSAVQTGPLLVEPGGKLGINGTGGPIAERSAICIAKDVTIVVAVTSRVTLYELASLLVSPAPKGFGCDVAINLDGGPSTQIATTLSGFLETFGNISPVQNFVAFFVPK